MAGCGLPTPILIRCATAADAGPACDVVRHSILECCSEDHRGDAKILDAWLRNKTPAIFESIILSPSGHSVVAEVDGAVVGFAACSAAGGLTLCYAAPAARFIGVGKALLAAIESHAWRAGITTLRLESTRTARAFYLRHGFVADGPPIQAFGMEGQPMRKTLSGSA
jgi:GNAT superfamily N-acetyltransferase